MDVIDIYFRDVRNVQKDNSDELVGHLRLIVAIAKDFRGMGVDFEDLIQEGNLSAVASMKDYDPSLGTISTFIGMKVRTSLWQYIQEKSTAVRVPQHFKEKPKVRPLEMFQRRLVKPVECSEWEEVDLLNSAIGTLHKKHRSVILQRLSGRLHVEIAEDWGCTPQSIRSLEKTAIRRLCDLFDVTYEGWSLKEMGVPPPRSHRNPGTRLVTAFGETKPIGEWARDANLTIRGLAYRIDNGMRPEEAIMKPSKHQKP